MLEGLMMANWFLAETCNSYSSLTGMWYWLIAKMHLYFDIQRTLHRDIFLY